MCRSAIQWGQDASQERLKRAVASVQHAIDCDLLSPDRIACVAKLVSVSIVLVGDVPEVSFRISIQIWGNFEAYNDETRLLRSEKGKMREMPMSVCGPRALLPSASTMTLSTLLSTREA